MFFVDNFDDESHTSSSSSGSDFATMETGLSPNDWSLSWASFENSLYGIQHSVTSVARCEMPRFPWWISLPTAQQNPEWLTEEQRRRDWTLTAEVCLMPHLKFPLSVPAFEHLDHSIAKNSGRSRSEKAKSSHQRVRGIIQSWTWFSAPSVLSLVEILHVV